MESIITSYLLQSGECSLANMGVFTISSKPAELDIAHKQILPPIQEISFNGGDPSNSPGLISYLSRKKNISTDVAESILSNYCNDCRERLDSAEEIFFEAIGTLKKDNEGNIIFIRENSNPFLQPVAAERVLHENVKHKVLVGDKEVSTLLGNEYIVEEPVTKRTLWWIGAACLGVLGIALATWHFSKHPFNVAETGNQTHVVVDSAMQNHVDITGN